MGFIFVEKDQKRAQTLRDVLNDHFPQIPEKMHYEVLDAEFAPTLESILDKLEKDGVNLAPTFAFLDHFGFSGLPMRLIGRMMNYNKCEVLITFMSGFVKRFTDTLHESSLDELFATDNWRKIRDMKDPKDKKEEFLLDIYVQQLKNVGNAKYILSFEMINRRNQTIYYLIYGTKHLKGLEVMKKAMWKVDRRGTYQFSDLLGAEQKFILDYSEESYWMPIAADRIFSKFKGQTVKIDEIYQFVIAETPYIFRKGILKCLEEMTPSKILNVSGRKKKFTYPDQCSIEFSQV